MFHRDNLVRILEQVNGALLGMLELNASLASARYRFVTRAQKQRTAAHCMRSFSTPFAQKCPLAYDYVCCVKQWGDSARTGLIVFVEMIFGMYTRSENRRLPSKWAKSVKANATFWGLHKKWNLKGRPWPSTFFYCQILTILVAFPWKFFRTSTSDSPRIILEDDFSMVEIEFPFTFFRWGGHMDPCLQPSWILA